MSVKQKFNIYEKNIYHIFMILVDFFWKFSMILADFLLSVSWNGFGSGSGWTKWNGIKRIWIWNNASFNPPFFNHEILKFPEFRILGSMLNTAPWSRYVATNSSIKIDWLIDYIVLGKTPVFFNAVTFHQFTKICTMYITLKDFFAITMINWLILDYR